MSLPTVLVKQGWLRGVNVENFLGKSHITFRGIPYAAPPVGNLRFKDPQPVQPWTGVRDSSQEGSQCTQVDYFSGQMVGDDDCLYLNVTTKSLTGSRPVMVWIHGGAFIFGNGGCETQGPDLLVESGIVYVSFNYRLGVLGFLNLDDVEAPGNMGLKDQVAALKWVKENIAQFGGDPNNVTIFGQSAGGSSAHYQLLSPQAKGLFNKAIIQSGVALIPWAQVTDMISSAQCLASVLGKDTTDTKEILEYFRTIPSHQLIGASMQLISLDTLHKKFTFGPTIDDKSVSPFLPEPPGELAKNGIEVPVIIGYVSHEGIFNFSGVSDDVYTKLDEEFESSIPKDLVEKAVSKVPEIARELRKFYFGENNITKDLIDNVVQYCGDMYFVRGTHAAIEIQRKKKTPTYVYKFSYESPKSMIKKLFQLDIKGAAHGAELEYFFFNARFRNLYTDEDDSTNAKLRKRLIRMWTDFAKTGNPTPVLDDLITVKWKPMTASSKNYLEIDAEITAGENPDQEMWEFWQRIEAIADD